MLRHLEFEMVTISEKFTIFHVEKIQAIYEFDMQSHNVTVVLKA